MNTRLRIGPAVLVLSALSSPLLAQTTGLGMFLLDPVLDRPSHLPLRKGLEEASSPEQLLMDRLQNARAQQRALEEMKLNGDLAKLAQKLLEDPKFLESFKESLKDRVPPEHFDMVLERYRRGRGENFADDRFLHDLVRKGLSGKKNLSPRDGDLLRRWAEKVEGRRGSRERETGPIRPPEPIEQSKEPPPPPVTRPPAPPAPPAANPTPWDRLPEGSSDWFKNNIDGMIQDLERWIDSPSGQSWSETFKEWARRVAEQPHNPAIAEPLRRFRGVLPRLSDYLPRPPAVTPYLPRLPPLTGALPSAPNLSAPSPGGIGRVLLLTVVLAVVGFLLWRSAGLWQRYREALAAGWHLGPWPVDPTEVSTRAELVRAFEYLALLCLGPAARTCHHLELGQRIGAQPALDADCRREAAQALARIYEQARYTPDDEPLASEDMRRARRELCYLAGVPAA